MTKLLVSVRDVQEARCAAENGADIIDLKEPLSGSLGRVSARAVSLVCETLADAPISVALGELSEPDRPPLITAATLRRISFAKIGPARIPHIDSWKSLWESWRRTLPTSVRAIAVAYADYEIARSPKPLEIVSAAASVGAGGVLIDTFTKSSRDLLGYLTVPALQESLAAAAVGGLPVALAGSVTTCSLPLLLPLRPAIIAVRGAVCDDGRLGHICGSKVRNFANTIRRRCGEMAISAGHATRTPASTSQHLSRAAD